jgi:hypothetical protein
MREKETDATDVAGWALAVWDATGTPRADLAAALGVAESTVSRWAASATAPDSRQVGPLCDAVASRVALLLGNLAILAAVGAPGATGTRQAELRAAILPRAAALHAALVDRAVEGARAAADQLAHLER